ncbi:DNA endonuclease [Synechocystis salina LEGE 06099]|uniref:LAGLIDADG endonuclease n=1 Tax=Synechocystis salina TaxID=945780 RepID=UPI00187F1FAE|nr:LAGLIDADG endonuclease [Synechocystis salina]MBE9203459.1 DNA endonuclease [Synechocystis salina LEGE 06099]
MSEIFQCPYCKALATWKKGNYIHRRTCENSECRKKLNRDTAKKYDQLRQKKKIQELKFQGFNVVTCQICNEEFEMIHHSHLKTHGLTVAEYRNRFPNALIFNSRSHKKRSQTALERSKYKSYSGKNIDNDFLEFLTGSLLGDGSLEKGKRKLNARYAEGGANKEYINWKFTFLKDYLPCSFQEALSSPHVKSGKQYRGWWIKTGVHPALTDLHSIWYLQKKLLPREFIEKYLTEFAFCIWFYDDGCSASGLNLYPMSFSEDDVEFLSSIILKRFNLKNSVLKTKQGHFFIKISQKVKSELKAILDKFPIPGMEYKRNF